MNASNDKNSISQDAKKEIKMSHFIAIRRDRETFRRKKLLLTLIFFCIMKTENPLQEFNALCAMKLKRQTFLGTLIFPPPPSSSRPSKDIKCKNEIREEKTSNELRDDTSPCCGAFLGVLFWWRVFFSFEDVSHPAQDFIIQSEYFLITKLFPISLPLPHLPSSAVPRGA